jgi:putative component of toxin-antitoxin plasmid stabilization module
MVVRSAQLRSIPSFLLPFTQSTTSVSTQVRKLHSGVRSRPIPKPTPFVPDTQTFLTLIGRNLAQYAPKIPTWSDLFTMDSERLKKIGIDSPRARRYLQLWRNRYRNGEVGIGGDLQHVQEGVAELRIVQVPAARPTAATATLSPRMRKIVVNVAPGGSAEGTLAESLKPVKGVKVKSGNTITGPHVRQLRGKAAKIEVTEGMWEIRRGRKIDGGERRQAEVRAKRRGEEKRAAAGGAR